MSEVEVRLAPLLHSYTQGASVVRGHGATVGEVLDDLDRRYHGLRFRLIDEQDRLRPHMRLFVGREAARDIRRPLADGDELLIFGALSGG